MGWESLLTLVLSGFLPPKHLELVGFAEWDKGRCGTTQHLLGHQFWEFLGSGSRTGEPAAHALAQPIPEAGPVEGPQHLTAELDNKKEMG